MPARVKGLGHVGLYVRALEVMKEFWGSFMGMTPTEYAETPHPILQRIMAQRMADQGAAPHTDLPTVARYGAEARPLD